MAPLYDEDEDYVTELHIQSFAKALAWEENDDEQSPNGTGWSLPNLFQKTDEEAKFLDDQELLQNELLLSPVVSPSSHSLDSTNGTSVQKRPNPEKDSLENAKSGHKPTLIKSKSDWFPVVGAKLKKRKSISVTEKLTNEFRFLASYTLLRWPFLIVIVFWVLVLCGFYAMVRVYVAMLEYIFTWTGQRKELRAKLRKSKTYEEWVQNAIELDQFLGLDQWSENPKFSYYDYRTIQKTIKKLRGLRKKDDVAELVVFLQGCLKKNFAGVENRQLYSHRYYGTKNLVDEYVNEVVACVNAVTDAPEHELSSRHKRRFFRVVLKNYGKTALCLSGGACFSYIHFGLVKALLDNDLLPLIISGTSGGGLIAALACTRTDDELRKLLVPDLARKITACEDPWYVWIPRLWKTGARFDSIAWARKSNYFTSGSTTFQEAFKLTGRKLNISTVPAEPHSPVILCNSITSPNCIIWSSLLASSAVPGILNPVVLMMKDPTTGVVAPFSMGNKWRDGSLRTDIPVESLNTYYNVNFSVVSQVNPHISLFFFAPKGTVGRPVAIARSKTRRQRYASLRGGFVATALEQLFKLEIKKWLQIVKTLDLLPRVMEQDWLNVWLQRFTGSITIWPRMRLKDFWYILLDPNKTQMEEYLLKGERSMFPRLLFLRHRLSIERAIDRGRKMHKLSGSTDNIRESSRSPFPQTDELSGAHPTMDLVLEAANEGFDSDSSDDEVKRTFVSPFDRKYNDDDEDDDDFTDDFTDDDDDDIEIGDAGSFSDSEYETAKPRRHTVF